MQIILNEHGYVKAYALIGVFGDVEAIDVDDPVDVADFEENYGSYYLSEGKLIKSDNKQKEIEHARQLFDLRVQRAKVCFPYINRGYLWYSKLTNAQKDELNVWYQAWLDVTDTQVVPETPAWLI
jgi:hypothetical protein